MTAAETDTTAEPRERQRTAAEPSESKSAFRRMLIGLMMLLAGVCFWNALRDSVSRNASDGVSAIAVAKTPTASEVHIETQPIELLTPGQRALARNPEISSAERRGYVEPDFHTWLLLNLELPKPDGSTLFIEMLRSKEWFAQQVRYIVAADQDANSQEPDDESLGFNDSHSYLTESVDEPLIPLSPLHPVYRDIAEVAETAQDAGAELIGLTVELDLPELSLTGDAIVTDIRTSPQIEPKSGNDDPRRVITATFHHTSGDVIDLVVTNGHGPNETFGTTINHPFWSVDRQEYVQAGSLEIGENLRTLYGDTKTVVSNLPRPGPGTDVYNLEVHAEHVYFVGENGVLVHNAGPKYSGRGAFGRDPAPKGLVRSSLPTLPKRFAKEFDGPVRFRTFKAGEKVHRSPWVPDELPDNPGSWFGTRSTATKQGTDSMRKTPVPPIGF